MGFFYGAVVQDTRITPETILSQLLPALVVIEFLLYQSRYQWNDIRGLSEDVNAGKAGRLPETTFGYRSSVNVSLLTIAIKIAVSFVIVAQMKDYVPTYACIIAILFILTVAYEHARKNKRTFWIFVLVCLGYPIRFFAGFVLSFSSVALYLSQSASSVLMWLIRLWPMIGQPRIIASSPSTAFLCVLFSAIAFLGGYCVILSWAREAIKQYAPRQGKVIVKPHYDYLVKKTASIKQQHPLVAKTNGMLSKPWNYTFLTSVVLFSVAAFFTTTDLLLTFVSEGLTLIITLSIVKSGQGFSRSKIKQLRPYLLFLLAIVSKTVVCLLFKEVSISTLLIIVFQILSMGLYICLRFVYIPKIKLKQFLQMLWLKCYTTLLGENTVQFLKVNVKSKDGLK